MMAKVIENKLAERLAAGVPDGDPSLFYLVGKQFECLNCTSIFEIELSDVLDGTAYRDTGSFNHRVRCPVCHRDRWAWGYVNEHREEGWIGGHSRGYCF